MPFMGARTVESQLESLDGPGAEERGVVPVDADRSEGEMLGELSDVLRII